ncbi:MAG: PAS domain S-box protein [Elusimicrobia bacterium]|nr:PAS domain S-box protein [Elusimicrobiota bacterium]
MPDPIPGSLDRPALDVLMWLAKTLGQMSLYKVGHPAVAATLQLAEQHLTKALQESGGELTFSADQGKWLANGRIIAALNQTPQSLPALFTRFKLQSITFKAGVSNAELVAFCELAAMRPDATGAVNPKSFLEGRGVSHIVMDEAVYAKLDKAPAAPAAEPAAGTDAAAGPGEKGVDIGLEAGAGSGAAPEGASAPAAAAAGEVAAGLSLEGQTLEGAIQSLVGRAVPEAGQRGAVVDRVMQLVAADIQRRVAEVTKALRREKNVLQNEAVRTQAVIGQMVEGVVVVDEQGKILMMNPAAEQIYGTTLAQAAGKPLAEKAGEEHMVTLASELTAPADREIRKDVATTAVEDTRRTLRSAGAVVQNEQGKVVGMVASLPDAAKHKELQRVQREFVAHITHELRAPLSSIRAALEILEEEFKGKLKADEEKMMSTALRNSDRLADMINSILDFSKIESGQMTVAQRQTNPEKIVREAVESVTPWASKKRLGLALSVVPGLPPVYADEKRTVQVLINLLSNAIKFTPSGGRITVSLSPSRESRERFLDFSVADTGPGIAKADQRKIFEKFVQIASGEMSAPGTGLGLSIAKALVHLQGGVLGVESELGRGAVFSFTLPVYVPPREEASVRAPAAKQARPWWKKLLGLK